MRQSNGESLSRTSARRLSAMEYIRLALNAGFILLGTVIVVQGIRLGAPWAYTVIGLLMAGLGAYRLRLARVLSARVGDLDGCDSGADRPG